MKVHRTEILVLIAMLLGIAPARAQSSATAPLISQAVRSNWLQFHVAGGRISLLALRGTSLSTSTSGTSGAESLSIRSTNTLESTATYTRSSAKEEISLTAGSDTRLSIRREVKQGTEIPPIGFAQLPGEPVALTVGEGDAQQVFHAPTVWHLLITHRTECQEHLVPLFEALHPDWKLADKAEAIERELLRMALTGQLPDLSGLDELVRQLGDDRFAVRRKADLKLREAGPFALSYLEGIDFKQLDAEQQYRVGRIVAALTVASGDDTPESFASRLFGNVEIWLALLSRPEITTRQSAARMLEELLDKPVHFDPAADLEVRETQIRQLRARIGTAS